MQDGEEWGPLLKEDVDHLVRHEAWGCLEGHNALWASSPFGTASAKEGV
jgi:hypothetical protein